MKITVLGKSPSWQDAGGAGSGYLIEGGGVRVVLDFGNGVFAKLRQHLDYVDVDAVVISHLHADHFLDLIPYSYALTYSPRQQPVPVAGFPGTDDPAHPRLIVPPGARDLFRRVVGAWGNDDLIENAFDLKEYSAAEPERVGGLEFRFGEVPHFIQTFAVDVSSEDEDGRFTFGADCRPNDELVEFARGTDLLIVEATLPRPERTGIRGHLTPGEAGDHARRAEAGRCILTHISDELDPDWARDEATRAYGAPAELAHEGAVYEV